MLAMSSKGKEPKRFLRRPLMPKVLPRLPITPPPSHNSPSKTLSGEMLVEPEFYYEEGEYPGHSDFTFDRSGTSPPPPSEHHTNTSSHKYNKSGASTSIGVGIKSASTKHTRDSQRNLQHGRFVLDPIYREQTNLGTYVEGKSLVMPMRPRGPCPLPIRLPVKTNHPAVPLDEDEQTEEERYHQPPEFTLQDFIHTVSEKESMPVIKVKQIMFSKHTYRNLQNLLFEHISPKKTTLTKVTLQPTEDMQGNTPRIPQKQLLIEMAALIKEQMNSTMGTNVRPLIRPLPKYSPESPYMLVVDYRPDKPTPHTEIVLYEDRPVVPHNKFLEDTQHSDLGGTDKLLNSPPSRYFQGSRRSQEPFNIADEESISPAEVAVLDCLVNGGTALSLKAMFIAQLPDIELLLHTLTYLNISFNDFDFIPYEIFELEQLTTLKMRNNPIREIPEEIGALKNLRVLVFSFCLVSHLPDALFSLKKLHHLDFSYNKVTHIQNDIKKLTNLRELNVEGNHLPAFPMGILRLENLKYVRVRSNFMHPLFWRENTRNTAPKLVHMALRILTHMERTYGAYPGLPETVRRQLDNAKQCDCCLGVMFGEGLKTIRPVSKVFNIRNLPIMFRCCSSACMDRLDDSETVMELLYGYSD